MNFEFLNFHLNNILTFAPCAVLHLFYSGLSYRAYYCSALLPLQFICFIRCLTGSTTWCPLPRGLGFASIIIVVTLVGYLGTRFFIGKWVFDSFAYLMEHTPGVKYIYSSVRDVIKSFVGDKRRFNIPVWVCVQDSPEIWRIGFMTQRDMAPLGMENKVAVYLPHAYAISGWVIVTDNKNIKLIKEMTAGEAMKFALSGGITTIDETTNNAKENKF